MKKIVVAVFILLMAGLATAQIPTSGNVFVGYSYYNVGSTSVTQGGGLNGWQGSLEGKIIPFVGIVADFSGNYGSLNSASLPVVPVGSCPTSGCPNSVHAHVDNFLFGPRVSVSVGSWRPFAEALFGVGHISTNGFGSDNSFATAIGGGLDYKIIKPIAVRVQLDYVHTSLFSSGQNNVRVATGIVVRF
jgi:opacity protein-like surface antigen